MVTEPNNADSTDANNSKDAVVLERRLLSEKEGISILLTKDGLGAFVIVATEVAKSTTPENVLTFLKEAGIKFGIHEEKIEELFKEKKFDAEQLVAWGKKPKPGKNGFLEYLFEEDQKKEATEEEILENKRVDYKNLTTFTNVKQGDILVRHHSPVQGIPGHGVRDDEAAPPKVKDVHLPKGRNTDTDSKNTVLKATIDGMVRRGEGKVHVAPIIDITGDVDFSVGNMDFLGTINIAGNILVDFKVGAVDDINVRGVVEGAQLKAGGSITINRGVQGMDKAVLEAGELITTNFISNATASARQVIVNGPIMHSEVYASERVVLSGKKGNISGGKVSAKYLIDCTSVGSEMGIRTDLEVGVSPELTKQMYEAVQDIKRMEGDLNKIVAASDPLLKLKEEGEVELPPDKLQLLEATMTARKQLKDQIQELEEKKEQLVSDVNKSKNAQIIVQGEVFPGTNIKIFDAILKVMEKMRIICFYREADGTVGTKVP
jgi:uncharacterized protein